MMSTPDMARCLQCCQGGVRMAPANPTILIPEPERPPEELPPGTQIDRYEVLGLLGQGGIARVYRVRHRKLGTIHALKVLAIDRPSVQERAIQEGRVQAALRHPNVVAVTDIITHQGVPVLVLEYVAGPSLEQLLGAQRLPLDEVDPLVRGILDGVAHAHAQGVVHRDLKPGNILLEVVERTLVPRVTDFGIAKLLAPSSHAIRTQAGTVMGTPAYMSPEQLIDSSKVDARADVWALGVLMYEMCTGRTPFDPGDANVHKQIATGRYLDPRTWVPELPDRMVRAIHGALRPDRSERITDAAALLTVWSDGERRVHPELGASCSATTLATAYAHRPQLIRSPDAPQQTPISTLRSRPWWPMDPRGRPSTLMWILAVIPALLTLILLAISVLVGLSL
ncbi:MAG TPA: serine/threonine protein kinase [Deltaproteobacteria bacterium]|nr:serine/threonine protein kinase [Deltaproteobacteria bacterium]